MNPNHSTPTRLESPDRLRQSGSGDVAGAPARPSSLYSARLWRLGRSLAGVVPHKAAVKLAQGFSAVYATLGSNRRETVVRNLLPVLDGDIVAARRAAARLYRNFAHKLVDLWRYEAGKSIAGMFQEWTGWEHMIAARKTGRGILLLTPHLGNWEFGAPLLSERGIDLLVITLEEPQERLTEMRRTARAGWGIETLVIGSDPFAFVEVLRRLEAGAVVALLIDRPPPATSIPVELFGREFYASVAAAELARASGCVLLPVYLPLTGRGYAAHILPETPYDRQSLRYPEARRVLTQQIVRAFEPVIRQHPDQWYHFVPIWPAHA